MTDTITQQTTEEIASQNQESRSQQRIKELSEKVELTAKERDEFKSLREKDQQVIADLTRENSFNSSFADILGSFPSAKDYKDDIKAKVLAGYDPTDAALAVLGKAGKLGAQPAIQPQNPAGGSADTVMVQGADKPVSELSQEERRAILEKELLIQ